MSDEEIQIAIIYSLADEIAARKFGSDLTGFIKGSRFYLIDVDILINSEPPYRIFPAVPSFIILYASSITINDMNNGKVSASLFPIVNDRIIAVVDDVEWIGGFRPFILDISNPNQRYNDKSSPLEIVWSRMQDALEVSTIHPRKNPFREDSSEHDKIDWARPLTPTFETDEAKKLARRLLSSTAVSRTFNSIDYELLLLSVESLEEELGRVDDWINISNSIDPEMKLYLNDLISELRSVGRIALLLSGAARRSKTSNNEKAKWWGRFISGISRYKNATFDAEKMGYAAIPAALPAICGLIAYICAGSAGAGWGVVVGNVIAGKLSPEEAVEKLAKATQAEDKQE